MKRLFTTFLETQSVPSVDILPLYNVKTHTFKMPQLESLTWLFSAAPCFPVKADNVNIIHEPKVFYDTLVSKSATAKKRIVLSSLYLGVGNLEAKLVSALHENIKENKDLRINILLDFTRGTRGEINSKVNLMPLVKESEKCCLSLYHTPALRGLTKKFAPPRWNELLGVQHMKLYLFDDTVIISGANLSNDYFTNRQDRYIMIEDKGLADFYETLVGKVQEFSLKVLPSEEVCLHPKWDLLPYNCSQTNFASKAKQNIFEFFTTAIDKQNNILSSTSDTDTWIFPLVEMGQLGIHHDSLVTQSLISSSLRESNLKFATGYFNLTQDYMSTLINNCLAKCSILMAHPNANGFQGAKGPAGGIPAAYSFLAKTFYENLVKAGQSHRVNLFEFEKPGWSYHAKGLWYYVPDSDLPSLTLIGSSNFGERSVNRDLESQICLVTNNHALKTRLQTECDNLYKLGTTAENEITNRPVPRWVQSVVWLFKNFF